MKATITNNSKAPQGIHLANGSVRYVGPGQTSSLEVADAYAERLGKLSFLAVKVDEPPAPPAEDKPENLSDHTVAELKEIAAGERIDLGDATKKADIIAAIELAREAGE